MAQLRMTKVRGFIAATFAIVSIILLAAVATAALGMRVPILSNIADALGL